MDSQQRKTFDYLDSERKESRRSPTQLRLLQKMLDYFDF